MFKNQLDFCQQFLIYRNITTPSEQYRKPKKVYLFRDDNCSMPVYLYRYLLDYGWPPPVTPVLV